MCSSDLRKANLPVSMDGLVLDVGAGSCPYPRADVLLERYAAAAHRCGGGLVADRPLDAPSGAQLAHPRLRGRLEHSFCAGAPILREMTPSVPFPANSLRVRLEELGRVGAGVALALVVLTLVAVPRSASAGQGNAAADRVELRAPKKSKSRPKRDAPPWTLGSPSTAVLRAQGPADYAEHLVSLGYEVWHYDASWIRDRKSTRLNSSHT